MSIELRENIDKATDMCIKQKSVPLHTRESFFKIFPFATENIAEYIKLFNLDNKSLLTVGSSGDQAINAILCGATNITEVDINPFAKYYYYLKMASILCLDMPTFLEFLKYHNYFDTSQESENNQVFSKSTFDKISDTLRSIDSDSYEFWNTLFSEFGSIRIRNGLFHADNRSAVLKKCNLYLSSHLLFDETKSKIRRVTPNFVTSDICAYDTDEKYDNIWLSNLASSLKPRNRILLLNHLSKNLNSDGQILMEYLYLYKDYYELTYRKSREYSSSNIEKVSTCVAPDGNLASEKDAVLIYRK